MVSLGPILAPCRRPSGEPYYDSAIEFRGEGCALRPNRLQRSPCTVADAAPTLLTFEVLHYDPGAGGALSQFSLRRWCKHIALCILS